MRKLLFALCLFTSSLLMSQEKAVTTEEEYNYLTKGYAEQLEKGGDMKADYELTKINQVKSGDYSFEFYILKQKSISLSKALLIIARKDKEKNDKVRYLCLPFNNSELFKKYYKDKEGLGITIGTLLDASLDQMLSMSLEKISNRCK